MDWKKIAFIVVVSAITTAVIGNVRVLNTAALTPRV